MTEEVNKKVKILFLFSDMLTRSGGKRWGVGLEAPNPALAGETNTLSGT
jgi:hypothetical protein